VGLSRVGTRRCGAQSIVGIPMVHDAVARVSFSSLAIQGQGTPSCGDLLRAETQDLKLLSTHLFGVDDHPHRKEVLPGGGLIPIDRVSV
jgi:hypothetical protein